MPLYIEKEQKFLVILFHLNGLVYEGSGSFVLFFFFLCLQIIMILEFELCLSMKFK